MSEVIFNAPSAIGGSNKIITLEEYKTRREMNEASGPRDEAIEAAIASAEDTILRYTGRDFSTAQVIEARTYNYDGSGILETDDFVEVTGVSVAGSPLTSQNFIPGPREGETFYYIDFSGVPRQSPAMGFTRNLDTIFEREGGRPGRQIVEVHVTAKFGWPGGAPASIKQAVVWLVDEFRKKEGNQGDIQAEGIADLNFVYQRMNEESALPARITALLDPYRRISL